ncbi:MAG: hypothetical protein ABJN84_13590 [Flavobacteriaceae bacterium]
MVEIKSKKTGKTLVIGKIVKETDSTLKLHTSRQVYKKSNIAVQYVIAILLVLILGSCKTKKYTPEQLERIRITDSIANAEKAMRMMDFKEELIDREGQTRDH